MRIDIHVHLADVAALQSTDVERSGPRRSRYLANILQRSFARPAGRPEETDDVNRPWLQGLARQVSESPLDRVVLLALDEVHDKSGRACPDQTTFTVANDFVRAAAAQDPAFLFGASIHPYRRDACAELERLVSAGACLVKWIPSAQRIAPDDPACFPFYEALAHHGIPLLSHTGIEHMLGRGRSMLNHPQRLVQALERGVTVIAAHCGMPLFLHERSFFGAWATLARTYEKLYGDISACAIVTRVPYVKRALRDSLLRERLVYGSDFPGIPSPRWCWQLGWKAMNDLARIPNPLDRNMRVMQALGTQDTVFRCAHDKIGIGKEKRTDAA